MCTAEDHARVYRPYQSKDGQRGATGVLWAAPRSLEQNLRIFHLHLLSVLHTKRISTTNRFKRSIFIKRVTRALTSAFSTTSP